MDKYNKAFTVLGLTIEADETITAKAYKKLALKHHPDRNPNAYKESTKRFQEIGAAWEICQEFYHYQKGPSKFEGGFWTEEDDIHLDDLEKEAFFQFLFEEIFAGRYNRKKTRQYRSARAGRAGTGVYAFTESFAESQKRQQDNRMRQKREHEEYLERVRAFERECQAEEEAEEAQRRKAKKEAAEALCAHAEAFEAARKGDLSTMRQLFSQHILNPNQPEKGKNKSTDNLLHAAAQSINANEEMVTFLLEKGAEINAVNIDKLTAFQCACRSGNFSVFKALLSHKDVHPSRTAKNGVTPLQLAIKGQSPSLEMIKILVKEATVHDVQKCWDMVNISGDIKDILKTKRLHFRERERFDKGGEAY
ncbi:hypothetical protein GYMLUDRAFT_296580 [Collybiopsis luxurians FD-317 M1]|nr:hypothetical protein GYMLUDRAFT_296580 [Collybiopsis luxurians FD-317 M1]